MKENNFDIVIVGNGLTAQIMCLVADHCNMSFINIQGKQKDSKRKKDSRVLALTSSTINMLTALGLEFNYQKVTKMIVFEGGVSDIKIKSKVIFDAEDLEENIAFIVEHSLIEEAIRGNLSLINKNIIKEDVVQVINGSTFSRVILSSQEAVRAKIIIFTERLDTTLQEFLQVKYNTFNYGQTAITATLEHSKKHQGHAYQFFLNNGPLALLPMEKKKEENYTSLVWTEKTENIDKILSAKGELERRLNEMCSNYLGDIKIFSEPKNFPLIKTKCKLIFFDRNILTGEAARSMHPLAGQAWNQSLRDLAYIADGLIESRKLGLDIISCPSITAFQKKRKIESDAFVDGVGFINDIFIANSSVAKGVRRNLMKAVNGKFFLKKLILNEASGGALDKPSLLMEKPAGSKII